MFWMTKTCDWVIFFLRILEWYDYVILESIEMKADAILGSFKNGGI